MRRNQYQHFAFPIMRLRVQQNKTTSTIKHLKKISFNSHITKNKTPTQRRLSKATYRILHSIDNGRTLSWAAPSSSSPSKKFPRFNLVDCLEIRHGWTVDPSSPSQTGTLVLRRKCHASESFTSFSLVYEERTIDFTAVSPDQAVILLRGLNGLCFKLKEERFVREEVLSQVSFLCVGLNNDFN